MTLSAVNKVFKGGGRTHEALKAIHLDIIQGEFLTILGPSGCGKTTLLRILAGFEKPTAGAVFLDGANITDVPPHQRPMSMVFQNYALFPHLTVAQNVAYGLTVGKVAKGETKERVEIVLSIMDLTGLEQRYPSELSGGQQQRVALARSIVVRPRVLLLDEPISNLDARLRDQMRSEFRRIQRQLGIASIYVTHDQSEAMSMSDRVVVMSEGRIEQVGTPEEVYREPRSLFVADFIGKTNILKARVIETRRDQLLVEAFGVRILVDDPGVDGTSVVLVTRPEDFTIELLDSPNDHHPNVVDDVIEAAGWLRSVEYFGPMSQLSVELFDGSLLTCSQFHTSLEGPRALPASGAGVVVRIPINSIRSVIQETRNNSHLS